MRKTWETDIIFKTIAGSQLYGTSTPTSDVDIRGVCHMPPEALIGLQGFEQYQDEKNDTSIFGLNKFCTLAAQCNPNIVEILFAPIEGPTCLGVTETWLELKEIRSAFISRKARHTFSGYAYSQLERINRHHRWASGEIPDNPDPLDFGAVPMSAKHAASIFRENWKTMSANSRKLYRQSITDNNFHWVFQEDQNAYRNARERRRQYEHWLNDRNPTRFALEQKWGYDTKNGMHLARLFFQGAELLQTCTITLPRPEAQLLLQIRNGLWTYEEIVEWARVQDEKMVRLEAESPLPWGPDHKTIEEFVMRTNRAFLSR